MANVLGPTFTAELAAAAFGAGLSLHGVSADAISGAVWFNGTPIASSDAPAALKTVVANTIAAHDPAAVDRNAAAALALATGVAVTCASAPGVSGVYGTSMQDEINLMGLQASISAGQPFLGYLRDKAGIKHMMNAAQFTELAGAILAYIAAVDAYAGGDTASLPPATATIA